MSDAITVCVVTHNRPDLLQRLLKSLASSVDFRDGDRIIVVENGGCIESESVVESAREGLNLEYLRCNSSLKSAALNMAIERVERGMIVFIDDDATPSDGWIAAYRGAYKQHGRGHYFGGPTTADYEIAPPEWLIRFLPDSAVGFDADQVNEPSRTRRRFLGFNWAVDVDDLRSCGGFSEDFGPGTDLGGGDETFMQFQLQQAGVTAVFVPDAVVSHFVPASRCSPAWALNRAYRSGICIGMLCEHRNRTRQIPTRRLRSLLRFLRKRTQRGDLMRLAFLQPSGRHWLRHCVAAGRGFWEGMRRGERIRPLSTKRWSARGLGESAASGSVR